MKFVWYNTGKTVPVEEFVASMIDNGHFIHHTIPIISNGSTSKIIFITVTEA